jgi:exonuclease III
MLNSFCYQHDVDILLLQEVTYEDLNQIAHHNKYFNVGTDHRGTAIFTKKNIQLDDLRYLPSGRGIAGKHHNLYIINLYAPSGTGRKKKREDFFTTEVPYLLQQVGSDYIIGGDYNCVLSDADCTGNPTKSTALEQMLRGCHLVDAWNSVTNSVEPFTRNSRHSSKSYLSKTNR